MFRRRTPRTGQRPPVPWRALVLVVVSLPLAVSVLRAREVTFPEPPATERLLYLRSGKVADRLMLSFDTLAADIYWIRAIQHYGRDRTAFGRPDRFQLLYPLLDLTTTLDPHFNIAYRFGAIFLSIEEPQGPGRTDLAIKLLEKGLEKNPTRWQYAHDIGFINYWYTRDYAAAAHWFERASKMPGAPEWIAPLAAITLVQGGDRTRARGLLTNLANSATEKFIRAAAERGLAQLQALDAIDELTSLVQDHERRTGQTVRGWHDLPQFGGGVPGDPTGQPYVYDAATRTVDLSPLSTLRPLPKVKSQQ
jgi:hypothetical protein